MKFYINMIIPQWLSTISFVNVYAVLWSAMEVEIEGVDGTAAGKIEQQVVGFELFQIGQKFSFVARVKVSHQGAARVAGKKLQVLY